MTDTTDPQTDRVTAIYDAIDAFQRTHRTGGGLQHAQIRALLAEHLDRALPDAAPSAPAGRSGLRERIAAAIWERQNPGRRWADCEYRWRADAEEDADAVLSVLPPAADRAATYRLAADAIESMQGYPRLILPEEIVAGLRLLAAGEQPEPGSPAYSRRLAAGERDEQQARQGDGAAPEEALDLSDGPVRCPLCPYPVTLHTPNGARAHFTTVHPEQRITGPGPWPLLATDGDEEQQAETQASWTPGPVAVARAAEWASQQRAATVDPAMCPRCRGDNSEAFELCNRCAATPPAVVAEPGKENSRG